jgi:outer membrane receptor protein involved in Fe transport
MLFALLFCGSLRAQPAPGLVEGQVISSETGEPLPGVTVLLGETGIGASSDDGGHYRIDNIPSGSYDLIAKQIGHETASERITIRAGQTLIVNFELKERVIEVNKAIVVTATREGQKRTDIPSTVSTVTGEDLREIRPGHPSEVMSLVPGVWVNVTGGEGHMTAIRQPLTTNPVYLYLEDGIPTRSTGFFNHNALYEINIPMGGGIEVTKGPGSALYGSDAIGGVVNVLTRPAPRVPEMQAIIEGGSFGWGRALLTAGAGIGPSRVRAELNLTHSDGWRDATDYDRQSGTVKWDYSFSPATVARTVATYSRIDQHTAGSSAISREDYENNPTVNYTPISFRQVSALRVSSALEHASEHALLSITPYFRYNSMDLLPNWSLSYDPTVYTTDNTSVGVAAKYRVDLPQLESRIVTGVDFDHSPGGRVENRLAVMRKDGIYESYDLGEEIYNYDVRFQEIAPYLHVEVTPLAGLRVTGGARVDFDSYNYETYLAPVDTGNWRRPGSTSTSYSHVSPKFGATYDISQSVNIFVSYSHGFRVPSEGQLFRQGSSVNTVGLKPVKVDNYETGLRGRIDDAVSFDISFYTMNKHDDILTYINPANGLREAVNAGKTKHRGVEVGLGVEVLSGLRCAVAYSYGKHTYEDWVLSNGSSYTGKEMETAPREIGDIRVSYHSQLGNIALELARTGRYWMDPANTHEYDGHLLLHGDIGFRVVDAIELSLKVKNITDSRFAESATYNAFRGEEFAPGMPRTWIAGLVYNLR